MRHYTTFDNDHVPLPSAEGTRLRSAYSLFRFEPAGTLELAQTLRFDKRLEMQSNVVDPTHRLRIPPKSVADSGASRSVVPGDGGRLGDARH